MKESIMSSSFKTNLEASSRTDWERVDSLTDSEIDTSDAPALSEEFFAKAKWLMPGESVAHQRASETAKTETVKVELDLDPQILAWFQSQGQDYPKRMRAALRLYAEAHQAAA